MPETLKAAFLKSLWEIIDYWHRQTDLSERDKLSGTVFSVLCTLDGATEPTFDLILSHFNQETGKMNPLNNLHEEFYQYKPEAGSE